MKLNSIKSRIGIAVALATIWNTGAFSQEGRPVAAADLTGKKICWDDGRKANFAPNGQFSNDQGQHSTWSVTEPGVLVIGSSNRQTVVLADGRLQQHWFVGRSAKGADKYRWGTVCN
jgi:hypothetical protein